MKKSSSNSAPRKPAARKKRGRAPLAGKTRPVLWQLGRAILLFPFLCFRHAVRMVRRWPRATLSLAAAMAVFFAITHAHSALLRFRETALPTRIQVDVDDENLRTELQKTAEKSLRKARDRGHPTSRLIADLTKAVSSLDLVDNCSIRSSLNGELQITATPQVPAFVLETQNSRYVVSSRLQIIRTEANPAEPLPVLSIPKLRLTWRPGQGFGNRPRSLRHMFPGGLNLPWLYQGLLTIQRHSNGIGGGTSLQKVRWDDIEGFTMHLGRTANEKVPAEPAPAAGELTESAPEPAPQPILVHLGKADLPGKIQRLKSIFSDEATRDADIAFVDLDYSGKAILRMRTSENTSTNAH